MTLTPLGLGEVVGSVPFQPSVALPPTALQELAPVTVQLNCVVPPIANEPGVAVKAPVNFGTPRALPLTVSTAVAVASTVALATQVSV